MSGEESIGDTFITGLASALIRQRLLENKTLDLKTMFDQAWSLESAARSLESYSVPNPPVNAAVPSVEVMPELPDDPPTLVATPPVSGGQKCFFCGHCSRCQAEMQFVQTVIK